MRISSVPVVDDRQNIPAKLLIDYLFRYLNRGAGTGGAGGAVAPPTFDSFNL